MPLGFLFQISDALRHFWFLNPNLLRFCPEKNYLMIFFFGADH